MDIFESLENLNVSEECFDDIMGIVEEILGEDIHSAIDKYYKGKRNKKDLHDRAGKNATLERIEAWDRERKEGLTDDEAFNKVYDKRNPRNTAAGKQDGIREISKLRKEYPENFKV